MEISNKDRIDLKNKRVSVIGLARSGVAAAKLAQELGAHVFVSDQSDSNDVKQALDKLQDFGIKGELNGH